AAPPPPPPRRVLGRPLTREAELVFALWRAFHEAGPGRRAGAAQALAAWRASVPGPVYALGLAPTSRMERRFLEDCRRHPGLCELPCPPPAPERLAWLVAALRPDPEAGSMAARARALRALPPPPVDYLAAADLETLALACARRIREALARGARQVAVVALDRLAARRLRAVLERDQILVRDETGWTFATTSVSHVVERWLCLVQDDFYHRDLLDLLKSPFVFADEPAASRDAAVAAFAEVLARHRLGGGLARLRRLAEAEAPAIAPRLARLAHAATLFQAGARKTLSGWVTALFTSLDALGALVALRADPAGRQLLDWLRGQADELAPDRSRHDLSSWRAWLTLQLDRATYVADEIDSPVCLTHLAALRLRALDMVLLLGADAGHFPARAEPGVFNEAVRLELGLPGQEARQAETLDVLVDVLARAGQATLAWQTWRGGEPNAESPWVARLVHFHALVTGIVPVERLDAQLPSGVGGPAGAPAAASLRRLPARLTASAWQDMVACPYRFFARYGLALASPGQVEETMRKVDYGERVHQCLKVFHARFPDLGGLSPAALLTALAEISAEVFAVRERDDAWAHAWHARWRQHQAAYLDWALDWAAQGWRWQGSEVVFEHDLQIRENVTVHLHGRVDRVDAGPEGIAVLDYKTQTRAMARHRLKQPGEYVQLNVYGLLTGATQAALVALDDDPVTAVVPAWPLSEAAAREAARMRTVLGRVVEGAPLPAHGVEAVCARCEMRGLCRRN
ncbi:MAG: PD-(D/E)XK nuclease family protein, partial [Pseudomonadota bacterium]